MMIFSAKGVAFFLGNGIIFAWVRDQRPAMYNIITVMLQSGPLTGAGDSDKWYRAGGMLFLGFLPPFMINDSM